MQLATRNAPATLSTIVHLQAQILRQKVRELAHYDQVLTHHQHDRRRAELNQHQHRELDQIINRVLRVSANLERQIETWTGPRWREARRK